MTERSRPGARPEARERVLQMVGNAHIDPVWLWQWPEGLAEVRATFQSALDRMDEYPEFIFTAGSAAHYEWVERMDPAMFEAIRARVAEGRWEIVGGWWVEPDCNLPGGESLVRQALLGQRYFASRFGRRASVGYNVDSFGHAWTLPQLLLGAGLDGYVFMRPQPHELDLPGELFWWEGPDGSRVLAARLPHEYASPTGPLEAFLATALGKLDRGWRDAMLFYGVGNHGGGPTRANLDSLLAMRAPTTGAAVAGVAATADAVGSVGAADAAGSVAAADPAAMPRLTLSSPERFFATIRARIAAGELELPVWRADLQHHARGCYAAHAGIKAWDRGAERALVTAESLRAMTNARDDEDLHRAWRNVAFNEFHDILAGTAIRPAYDDARDQLGEATSIARRATAIAFQRLARTIDLPLDPETRPIVALNPHPWPVETEIELELSGVTDDDSVVDDSGIEVVQQRIQSLATASDSRQRRLFRASLPAFGYRTFHLVPRARAISDPTPASPIEASDGILDNGRLRLEVDRDTGWIRSLVDVRSGSDVAGAGLARAIVLEDRGDTWSHDLVGYDRPIGPFVPLEVRLVEAGPARATIRVDARFGGSRLLLDVSLGARSDQADLRVRVDWREPRRVLKLRFGTSLDPASVVATAAVPFGAVARPTTGSEEPGGPWADLSGRAPLGEGDVPAGLLVLTGTRSGLDALGPDLGITLLRSPIHAHHDPRVPDEAAEVFTYQDLGWHDLRLALVPHAGDWRSTAPARRAAQLAEPPLTLLESFHPGPRPRAASLAEVTGDGMILGALKPAEDGEGLVLRLVETLGRSTSASVRLKERSFETSLEPWQVRTFRVLDPGGPNAATASTAAALRVIETDLLEEPLA